MASGANPLQQAGRKALKADAYTTLDVPVQQLLEAAAPYNPRTISDVQLKALQRSLSTFGAVEPAVVNVRSGNLVGGHQRSKAAAALGWTAYPCAFVDLDDAAERQLNLALNRIGGQWDHDALARVLDELHLVDDVDLQLTGFSQGELERELSTLLDDDQADPATLTSYGGATAMQRASAPLRWWKANGHLGEGLRVLDLGCGTEVHGFAAYDIVHAPDPAPLREQYDRVMLNYVLNVQPHDFLVVQLCALAGHMLRDDGQVLLALVSDRSLGGTDACGGRAWRSAKDWEALLSQVLHVERVQADAFFGWTGRLHG